MSRPADAIVVFGAAVWATGPCALLRSRLRLAAALHAQGRAPLVFCSGGWSEGRSEARAMADALVALGVPRPAIIVHEEGRSTRETLAGAGALWRDVVAVSSDFHLGRILAEARRHGLRATGEGARTSPTTRRRHAVRERAARAWYAATAPSVAVERVRRRVVAGARGGQAAA